MEGDEVLLAGDVQVKSVIVQCLYTCFVGFVCDNIECMIFATE